MGKWLPIAILIALGLLAAGWIAKRILLDTGRTPDVSNFEIGLDDVRRLARPANGDLPLRVNNLVIAESTLPRTLAIAGAGFSPLARIRQSFQVVYADSTLVIDSGFDRTLYDEMPQRVAFHPEAFDALQAALRKASTILVTHEHADHLGGISRSPYLEELLPRLLLTREQLENTTALDQGRFPPELRARIEPLDYARYHVVSPGVVLIKAPGHSPGSQMIYVILQNGTEFLFVGDVARHMENVERPIGRPLLTSRVLGNEDRDAVLHQLRALHELIKKQPIHLVVAHDAEQLREHVASGRIGASFE